MLYLVMEHYDNGESWEDHYESDTPIGIYESKELADKQVECVVEECMKDIDAHNKHVIEHECPNCQDICKDTCTYCLRNLRKTKTGYVVIDCDCDNSEETYSYSVMEIELNKRIK